MKLPVEYLGHSKLESSVDGISIVLTNNMRRPIRFRGVIRRGLFPLRQALRALGMIFWSDLLPTDRSDPLDPFLTVLPDQLILEGYRTTGTVYGAVLIDAKMFDIDQGMVCGTSQVHFPPQLWRDLQDLRSSRETTLLVGSEDLSGTRRPSSEKRDRNPEVPVRSLARLLQFQERLGKPDVRLEVAPLALMEILNDLGPLERFVDANACRMEKDSSGQPRIVLEPWEKSYPLGGEPRDIPWELPLRIPGEFRNWHILSDLVPYADSAYLQFSDRDGPIFCWVKLGGITFVLGITERDGSTDSSAKPILSKDESHDPAGDLLERGRNQLRTMASATSVQFARNLAVDEKTASKMLARLCRQGHCFFDPQGKIFRHRELFDPLLPESSLFQKSDQAEMALRHLQAGAVNIDLCFPLETTRKGYLKVPKSMQRREMRRRKRVDREWHVHGKVGDCADVRIVVNRNGCVASGLCTCAFYEENLMTAGPCQHMTALLLASASQRPDLPSSVAKGGTRAR